MPDIRIELQERPLSRETIAVAFYYDIPVNLRHPAAVDNTRLPALGARSQLSSTDIAGLRAGSIHEYLKTFTVARYVMNRLRNEMEGAWTELRTVAAQDYADRYGPMLAWNGSAWA